MTDKKKNSTSKLSNMMLTFFLIFCGFWAVFSLPTFILMFVGMVPTIVAIYTDKRPERYLAISVFGCNLLGCSIPLLKLFKAKVSFFYLQHLLADSFNWLWMYMGAASGWLIYIIVPLIITKFYVVYDKVRIELLYSEQKKLIEEWGEDVKS